MDRKTRSIKLSLSLVQSSKLDSDQANLLHNKITINLRPLCLKDVAHIHCLVPMFLTSAFRDLGADLVADDECAFAARISTSLNGFLQL